MSKPFLGTDFWHQHVQQCMQEGISQTAYCRQHGLVIHQFGYWYRKLATDHTSNWLPVEVKPVSESMVSLDLILAGERTLRIKAGFDEAAQAAHSGGGGDAMILGQNLKVFLWSDVVDLRKGFDGLSVLVQEVLKEDPFSGKCFVFKNRRSNRLKLLFWDGSGFVLAYKRLDRGTFYWPPAHAGKIRVTPAELSLIFDGIDWRRLPFKKTNNPTIAA